MLPLDDKAVWLADRWAQQDPGSSTILAGLVGKLAELALDKRQQLADAAKDEQGQIEARIIVLQHILENARVGAPPRTDGVVGPGMTVTIRFVKDDDEVTFLLASREESGSPIDVYSPRSPLGAAITGKKVGDKATYSLPNGRANTVEILEAVPYVGG